MGIMEKGNYHNILGYILGLCRGNILVLWGLIEV